MAEKVLTNIKVRNRIDTSTNWSTANPVLLSGEIGVVKDDNIYRMKVGDGTTAWESLPFITQGNSNLKLDFSIAKSASSTTINNSQITVNHVVSEIIFTSGRNYITSNGTWTTNAGNLVLTFPSALNGAASGYVILTYTA